MHTPGLVGEVAILAGGVRQRLEPFPRPVFEDAQFQFHHGGHGVAPEFVPLDLARDLKRAKYARTEQEHLKGKEVCLIFEKTSTRTRCSFEVACHDQGANVTYLDPSGSQIGHKESFKDTARVLGRMCHGAVIRTFAQKDVEEFADYAKIPTVNALTDDEHPCQILADIFTFQEKRGSIVGKKSTP